jgi:hypothetical protein
MLAPSDSPWVGHRDHQRRPLALGLSIASSRAICASMYAISPS